MATLHIIMCNYDPSRYKYYKLTRAQWEINMRQQQFSCWDHLLFMAP